MRNDGVRHLASPIYGGCSGGEPQPKDAYFVRTAVHRLHIPKSLLRCVLLWQIEQARTTPFMLVRHANRHRRSRGRFRGQNGSPKLLVDTREAVLERLHEIDESWMDRGAADGGWGIGKPIELRSHGLFGIDDRAALGWSFTKFSFSVSTIHWFWWGQVKSRN